LKFRDFIEILEANGFKLARSKAPHHFYEGTVNGVRHVVNCDFKHAGEDIPRHNFHSMIRQSGLHKNLFR
jgi:predicted RNA binding protein YcfA (HicA-like mRNA interferase family)